MDKTIAIELQLEGQYASLISQKISFQFQPAKFEIFKSETDLRQKLSQLHKDKENIFRFLL